MAGRIDRAEKFNRLFGVASSAVYLETDVFDSQDGAEVRSERGIPNAFL